MIYFKNDLVTLYNGDSKQILKDLDVQFNSIITDPPYAINFQKNHWDKKTFEIGQYSQLFYDKLSNNGNLILFQGWSNVCKTINDYNNFKLKNWIIWDRVKGRGAKTNFVSTRQDILWFVKDQKNYTFNIQPSNIKKKTGGSIGTKNGCEYRKLSNVWTDISPIVPWSQQREKHPTQKPLQIIQRLIRIFSKQNDIILDPFGGSGTTAIACMNLNRKCIIIQKQQQYCEIIKNRLQKWSVK